MLVGPSTDSVQPDLKQALPRSSRIVDREAELLKAARGKRVLHVGFVDYPVTAHSIDHGAWLHAKLAEVASRLVGIDVDEAGVDWARKHGYEAVVADLQQALPADLGSYDLVIAGEILEHLIAPGLLLRNLLATSSRMVVTVPNALRPANFLVPLRQRVEPVSRYHTAWYSPSTLKRLLELSGWEVERLDYFQYPRGISTPLKRVLVRIKDGVVRRRFPFWGDGIVAWCRPSRKDSHD